MPDKQAGDRQRCCECAPIMERGGHPPMPRPCYFITDQLLSLWPPIRRFSPPPPGGERWNGGNLRHLSRKISGQHARMHRVIWNIVEGPQQTPVLALSCLDGAR
jgi:hypothetical protein